MDAHAKLRDWWARTGSEVTVCPASTAALGAIATRYDLILPEEFYGYLLAGAPVAENWDDHMGYWWPADRIKNIPDEYSHGVSSLVPNKGQKLLFFLDHCIWCWAWAISCETGPTFGKIALIGGHEERFVADTFSAFVDRYITDLESVC
jgi:hypothetical protein